MKEIGPEFLYGAEVEVRVKDKKTGEPLIVYKGQPAKCCIYSRSNRVPKILEVRIWYHAEEKKG